MVLLGAATCSVSTSPCAPSAAVRRSGAPFLAPHNYKSNVSSNVPRLVRRICTRRLWSPFIARAEVGAQVEEEEELRELPGDEKPRQAWHSLPSGLRLEVLSLAGGEKAPLVFLHGSYHAAWCWSAHWLPHFASLGHDCYAVSLLGQGASDSPSEPGTLQSHARDVAHFISARCERPPVLVGHSFGGLIVQQYLSQVGAPSYGWSEPYPDLAGAVLACSVPPTGNSAVVKRFLVSKPVASIKVTLSLAAKMFATSVSLCRETFFSPSMPEAEVLCYQKLMRESSKVPLFDLRSLNASLPVNSPVENAPPVLVLGAENDFILDKQGIEETASFLGTREVIVPGIAHDVMLDVRWRDAADVLESWMQTTLQ